MPADVGETLTWASSTNVGIATSSGSKYSPENWARPRRNATKKFFGAPGKVFCRVRRSARPVLLVKGPVVPHHSRSGRCHAAAGGARSEGAPVRQTPPIYTVEETASLLGI